MKPSLSKREKVLVLAVAYIGIFYLMFQFAIVPTFGSYQDLQVQHDTLTTEKSMVELKIASEETYINQNKEHKAALEALLADYPLAMRNEQIDDVLTGLCVANGLAPVSLSLSAVQAESQGAEAQAEDDVFLVVAAKMTANGSIARLQRLLDRIEDIAYIRVSRLSFQDRAGVRDGNEYSVTLHFEVTMLRELPSSQP